MQNVQYGILLPDDDDGTMNHSSPWYSIFYLCWGFTAQSTQWGMSSAVSLPNHTFTGQA